MNRQANTQFAASEIRERYNNGSKNLRQLSEIYNCSISHIKNIVSNKLFTDFWYTPSERGFDTLLATLMIAENYTLERISQVCSTGKIYSCQSVLNKVKAYKEAKTKNNGPDNKEED